MAELTVFSLTTLFYWTVAFTILEALTILSFYRFASAKTTAEYYRDLPKWVSVGGDYVYSTLIFLAALWVFSYVRLNPMFATTPWFFVVFILTQWTFDLTYATIIRMIPAHTRYIDYFQRYIKEIKFFAALGDSLYGIVWLLILWFMLKYVPFKLALFILFFMIFMWIIWAY
jgi:hypothetical protein